MRILLDECVHAAVKAAFPHHAVKTVTEAGWRSSKDGPLLSLAEKAFDIFVTIDQKLERQQDLTRLKLGCVIAHVPNNRIESYRPIFGALLRAAESVKTGEVVHVRRS